MAWLETRLLRERFPVLRYAPPKLPAAVGADDEISCDGLHAFQEPSPIDESAHRYCVHCPARLLHQDVLAIGTTASQ